MIKSIEDKSTIIQHNYEANQLEIEGNQIIWEIAFNILNKEKSNGKKETSNKSK